MANPLFENNELEQGKKKDNDAKLPPELEGKSPAEIATIYNDMKAKIEAGQALDGRLKEVSDQLKALQNPPATATDTGRTDPEPDFYTKPKEAAEALFDKKVAPLVQAFLSNQEVQLLQAVKDLPYAKDYFDEIKQVIQNAPAAAKVNPLCAREAYNLVVGRHLDDIQKKEKEAAGKAPEFTETTSSGGPRRREEPSLSDAEKRVADAQGIPYDKYILWRDKASETADAMLKSAGK